jgi:hypothetical protein
MDTFKHITICIPIGVYNRVEKLAPRKKWGRNDVQEFHTQIYLDGLEHSRFLNLEHRRNLNKLALENSILKAQLAIANNRLGRNSTEKPPQVDDSLARLLEQFADAKAKSTPDSAERSDTTVTEQATAPGGAHPAAAELGEQVETEEPSLNSTTAPGKLVH